MRSLLFAALFIALPASAGFEPVRDGIPVTVQVVDSGGRPIPTAVIRHREEKLRHGVNVDTGKWRDSRMYYLDGDEPRFKRGAVLQFDAFAPGFQSRVFQYEVVAYANVVQIELKPLGVDLSVAAASFEPTPEVLAALGDLKHPDPALSLAYGARLATMGPGQTDNALSWVELARQEAKSLQGQSYVDFINQLYQVRTMIRYQQWSAFEGIRAHSLVPTYSSVGESSDRARRRTARLAEEWVAWAESTGGEIEIARDVCLSASAHPARCH